MKNADVGDKVGRLLIKEVFQKDFGTYKKKVAICVCDCGTETTPMLGDIRSGKTTSCGCYNLEQISERATKHGLSESPLYGIWSAMIRRCYNTDHNSYHNYGGRGIVVCDRWKKSVENFIEDVSDIYVEGFDMDRIDTNGNYCLENVRWVPRSINLKNKRKVGGVTSKYKGVSYHKTKEKWTAFIIDKEGNQVWLGRHFEEKDAAKLAYQTFKQHFGYWPPYCEEHLEELGLTEE